MLETAIAEVLQVVFPADGFVRFNDANGGDRFFQRPAATGAWTSLTREGTVRLDEFVARHATAHVRFSPTAWRAPSHGSQIVGVACVWAAMRYRDQTPPRGPKPRVLPDRLEDVRARLTGAGWFPSVLLNEGDRLTAFWALERPLTNPAHIQWLLRSLAERVGANADLTDPATAMVRVPGTRAGDPGSSRTVRVEMFNNERRYSIADIERLVKRTSGGRSTEKHSRVACVA